MKKTETKTKLVCQCGRTHQVSVNLLVKENSELERENHELRIRLANLKRRIELIVEEV